MPNNHTNRAFRWSAAVVLALPIFGCGGVSSIAGASGGIAVTDPFVDTSGLPALSPARSCAGLAGLNIPSSAIGLPTSGGVVTEARLVAAAAEVVGANSVTRAIPAYCSITARVNPVNPASLPITIRVNVPTAWNQKAIQIGGGGLNGEIPASLAAIAPSGSPTGSAFPPDAPYPIARGYALFGGDSGHQERGTTATWALDDEAWANFASAGLKKTHDAAHYLIAQLYASQVKVSYFMGQSQGGREALEVAQKYPADYDGIVATAPLIGYTAHVIHKTLLATAQTGGGWIPKTKLAAIGAEVTRQCDALDGLADGVISNYLACNALFQPERADAFARIRCAGGADTGPTCLSDAQIATIDQMHAPTDFGFALANGLKSFPGYSTGREGLAGWLNTDPQPTPTAQPALGQPGATMRYGILKDPAFNLVHFTVAAHQGKIQAASALIDSTNPDLSAFFARGGKLIVKSNASDYSANPQIMMRYYDALVGKFGQATVDRHVRYYVLPNGNHSGDGVSTTTHQAIPQFVDLTAMATAWVEKNQTPADAPVLSAQLRVPPYTVSSTRPMCRYPNYPKYAGAGDVLSAGSFICTR